MAKAGQMLAATLGGTEATENDDNDFSGSELEVTAGYVAVSLSSAVSSIPSGDANLDLGCLVSMTSLSCWNFIVVPYQVLFSSHLISLPSPVTLSFSLQLHIHFSFCPTIWPLSVVVDK
jgi:hypothetical protein